jgi:regulator of sirC expression with transglutaminase-like and TPR domain
MTHYSNGESGREAFRPRTQQPVEPLAHYYRGLVELSLGANDEARTDFETFLSLAPDRPEAATAREYLGYLTKSDTPQ